MLANEELLLIIYFVSVILFLSVFGVVFFMVFQHRKNKLILEKLENEKRFEAEIVKSRLEIQEQTLKNVGWELHDNIGQLLSVANMQLNILQTDLSNPLKSSVLEVKSIIANSLQEVRSLSKSLNNEVIEYAGLEASVKNELLRFERLNILKTTFETSGISFNIPQKDEILLFRILQEFFANVIKHAQASHLDILFNYKSKTLTIIIKDNGVGFNVDKVNKSSGLLNMESRAKMLGTTYQLESQINTGTTLTLEYHKKL